MLHSAEEAGTHDIGKTHSNLIRFPPTILRLSSKWGGEPISDVDSKFANITTLRTASNTETTKRG